MTNYFAKANASLAVTPATPSRSKGPSLAKVKRELIANDVVEAWLKGGRENKPMALALRFNVPVQIITNIISDFRKEALESNRASKEQLATDQIERLREINNKLHARMDEDMPISSLTRLVSASRQIEKDISELQGLTKGTTIQHIQEVKMIKGLDVEGLFPPQEDAVITTSIKLPDDSVVEVPSG